MDGMLSQEEINALLNSMDSPELSETESEEESLSSMEKDAMGEISNISMGTAATTLSSLVNQKVDITTPTVALASWEDLVEGYEDKSCVLLQISYKEGLNGNNVFILEERDVKIIADLMMGGDGRGNLDGELTELHLSAISEAMNQMMGSASTSMSSMLNMKIDISPPVASSLDMQDIKDDENLADFLKGNFVKISFKMTIGDFVDSTIMQLFPVEFCKTLCNKFGVHNDGDVPQAPPTEAPAASQQPAAAALTPQPQQPMQQPVQQQAMSMGQDMYGMPMNGAQPMQGYSQPMMTPMQGMPMGYPQQMPMQTMPNINVQQAQFQAFSPDVMAMNQRENIDLIMDVPLEVTVELGRTRKSIQDILEFAPGTIIELNKIAGEPIDVLVNGKYVAKGEVVVIEESFGVRVTEIIKN